MVSHGLVVHTGNPTHWGGWGSRKASSRPAWTTQWDLVLKIKSAGDVTQWWKVPLGSTPSRGGGIVISICIWRLSFLAECVIFATDELFSHILKNHNRELFRINFFLWFCRYSSILDILDQSEILWGLCCLWGKIITR